MFLILALMVLAVWGFGSFALHAGGLIHLLPVVALLSVIAHFSRDDRRRTRRRSRHSSRASAQRS